jgi:hypothetical protein
MDIETDELMRFPDSRRAVMKTPMGEVTMVSSPAGAFMQTPMGTQDMPSSQREVQAREAKTDLLTVLKNVDNPKYVFTASAPDTLEINAEGASATWVIDPASGKVLRKISQGRGGEQVVEYSEWKTFDGVTLPVAYSVKTGGQDAGSAKTGTVEINPSVDPKVFVKP